MLLTFRFLEDAQRNHSSKLTGETAQDALGPEPPMSYSGKLTYLFPFIYEPLELNSSYSKVCVYSLHNLHMCVLLIFTNHVYLN